MNDPGKIAYEAYCEAVGWKNIRDEDLPSWEQQLAKNPHIANAWKIAADTVINRTYGEDT